MTPLTPLTATRDNPMPIDALGEAIAELAARIHAATYELLVMIRQFDAEAGWNNGFLSCAHWLNWRTGIDMGAAREKVRVARALPGLPLISAALRRGSVSYAKVRAITRIATPETEQKLLDVALAGTASHVERIVSGWRRVDRVIAAKHADARHLSRHLTCWTDDDGMVVLRGRLTPEIGAVVMRALNVASDQLFRESKPAPNPGGLVGEVDARQRKADALGRLAEVALAADLDAGTAGDRFQVVLHVDVTPRSEDGDVPFDGALEVDDAAIHVSAETSRRLACDAAVVRMRHIEHWMDGGPTSLDNLVLLCRRHHRLVHEGGLTLRRQPDATVSFFYGDGTRFGVAPPQPRFDLANPLAPTMDRLAADGITISPRTLPTWDGTPFNAGYAIDVLYVPPANIGT